MTLADKSSFKSDFYLKVVEMEKILKDADLHMRTRALTLGAHSGMNKALDYYQKLIKERPVRAKGIYAYYHPFACAELAVGWALLTHESDNMCFYANDGNACVQVFVEDDYRRHGVGTALLKKAAELSQDTLLRVYEWSNYSFFAPFMQKHNFKSV